jgi:superfamily II DNA or RNA helicase/HKD family nuclease
MTNFITNEAGKDLKKRLVELIENSKELKFLVGFFYFSGIAELYESIKDRSDIQMNVLVGLNADKGVHGLFEYSENSNNLTNREKIKNYFGSVKSSLASDEFDNEDFEKKILFFIDLISSGQLQIRKTLEPNHAKLYIFKIKDQLATIRKSVFITGSSNLTHSGLSNQHEFNVELGDFGTEDADKYFDELWENSIKITETEQYKQELINLLKQETLIAEPTPFEAYASILQHYLDAQSQVEVSSSIKELLEKKGYTAYKYQLDATSQALGMIEEVGGVIIADVVGLGKSVITGMVAKQLGKRGLVICPPGLVGDDNKSSGWKKYLEDFELYNWDVRSCGVATLRKTLSFIQERNDIEVIVIDEAHRFRNQDTEAYELLSMICKNRKVILLTATPFNNSPADIFALLKLFIIPGKSQITVAPNLSVEFRDYRNLFKKLSDINKNSNSKDKNKKEKAISDYAALFGDTVIDVSKVNGRIKYISNRIRQIIEPVVIRRNRIDLRNDPEYSKEVKDLSKVADPREVYFELSKEQSNFYDRVIGQYFCEDGIFTGAMYRPFIYEKGLVEGEVIKGIEENFEYISQTSLFHFMRRLLIKRFESSFNAFAQSINNFHVITSRALDFIDKTNGQYTLNRNLIDTISDGDDDEVAECIAQMADSVEDLVNDKKSKKYKIENFKEKDKFLKDLKNDKELFEKIKLELESLKLVENDPKVLALSHRIDEILSTTENKNEPERKIVIFTEYADTAKHIFSNLDSKYKDKVLSVHGSTSTGRIDEVLKNFDASQKKQEDNYSILVGTDKISEGFNLSRCGAVVNYDIPWNPTRVIQRVGRINRIGQKVFENLYIYNFFPTVQGSEHVKNREIAENKMFMIHSTLGEDSKIFSSGEIPTAACLFTKIQQNPEEAESESFITTIRRLYYDIKIKYPEVIEKIKKLPARIKVAKQYKENDLLVFIRKGRPLFVRGMINEEKEARDLNIEEVLERIKSTPEEKSVPRSVLFWENYEKAKFIEQKTQYSSQMAIETKSLNNLNTLLQNIEKFNEDIQDFAPFIRTLLDDLTDYQTLSTYTLRRIADLPTLENSKNNSDEILASLNELKNNLGLDYLDKIKAATKLNTQEVVIAIENIV